MKPRIKKQVPIFTLSIFLLFSCHRLENEAWDRESVTSRAFSEGGVTDFEVRGQKLTSIKALKRYFFKGDLEITPENHQMVSKHTEMYDTTFKTFDRGLFIKEWKASLGFETLAELLFAFEQIQTFRISINWDREEGDIGEIIARAVQFYENLAELDISNCRLTDKAVLDIRDSIQAPAKLKFLNVSGNKLSKETLIELKQHFPNLASFKSDGSFEAEISTKLPPVEPASLQEVTSKNSPIPQNQQTQIEEKEEEKKPLVVKLAPPKELEQKIIDDRPNPPFLSNANVSSFVKGMTDNEVIKQGGGVLGDPPVLKFSRELKQGDILKLASEVGMDDISMEEAANLLNNALSSQLSLTYNYNGRIPYIGVEVILNALAINKTLTNLNLSCTELGRMVGPRVIASALETNKTLTSLNLWYNDITGDVATGIAKALKINETLTDLNLGGNGFYGAESIKYIASALETNRTLTSLNLYGNYIGEKGAQAIAKALEINKTLTNLNLYGNNIGDEGAQALAKALEINKTLTDLNLGGASGSPIPTRNSIGSIGAEALASALAINKTLTNLNLSTNKIGEGGAQALAKALKINETLTSLDLSHNNEIGEVGAQAIGEALAINKALTDLSLEGTWFCEIGAQAVASALETNKTLTNLDLRWNNIGDVGAQALASALEVNKTLTSLNLYGNYIGDEGAQALASALVTNETLTNLTLYSNNIGEEGAKALAGALKVNKTLTNLNLNGSNLGGAGTKPKALDLSANKTRIVGIQALASALEMNRALTSLNLNGSNIDNESAQAIAKALEVNKTLTDLSLSFNNIGDEGAQAIAKALEKNIGLKEVRLKNNRIGVMGKKILQELRQHKPSLKITGID